MSFLFPDTCYQHVHADIQVSMAHKVTITNGLFVDAPLWKIKTTSHF